MKIILVLCVFCVEITPFAKSKAYRSLLREKSDLNTQDSEPVHLNNSDDALLDFKGLAAKYIRQAEEYDVITEDGYILKLFRIPGNVKKVIIVGHGILISSDDFILRGNTSLIYMIAKQDFDVWAMNFRGNRYSRRHVRINPDEDEEFWQYSMHEMGVYDYKAVVDFVLAKTGQNQLSIIGHSEGGSAFFVLTSQLPEYNKKIKLFVGLSPVCYLSNSGPLVTTLLKSSELLSEIFKAMHVEEFIGYHSLSKKVIDVICTKKRIGYELCLSILSLAAGFNPGNIEQEFFKTIIGHFPAGTTKRNLEHYAHIFHRNKFVQYDYGAQNYGVYGLSEPPVYNLKKTTTKVALFAGKGDKIVGVKDIERLRDDLSNVVHYQVVSDEKFNHLDFVWGRNAYIVLYPYVVDVLLKYG